MIDIESLKKYKSIKIIGHKHADFDSMASGYLLEHIFVNLGINAEFVLQDGEIDAFFKEKWIGKHKTWKRRESDALFLVDHTAHYDLPVIGCFDHHPELVHIEQNYVNEPKTSCAKVIYDWTKSIGFEVPRSLVTLVVYACYMDSLSFKSTKARPEDLEWCHTQIKKYAMDETEVVNFGYGLTPQKESCFKYITNGLKSYPFEGRTIKSSYVVTKNDGDLDTIANMLKNELCDDVVAWCFAESNVSDECTNVLLVTKDYYLMQTIDKLLSRGKDIIPAVMAFLSAQNDGTVTKMLIDNKLEIATMESCTSGLIASNITDYEGASAILRGSSITYSNDTKIFAGVRRGIIEDYGVYSPETAYEMALTTKMNFDADIGVGITGSFGNLDPANPDSVAGVIYYEILKNRDENPIKLVFPNVNTSRKNIKQKTVDIVLATLQTMLARNESTTLHLND
jgi:PncC family amidohydrolase